MSRTAYKTSFRPSAQPEPDLRACDWPDCSGAGEHRASKSPREMDVHMWYCMDHIRAHNKSWNYFEGMSEDEVEADVRNDTVWQRETWDMGDKSSQAKARMAAGDFSKARDAFGFFKGEAKGEAPLPPRPAYGSKEAHAAAVLDLEPPINEDTIKARYKQLVKRHHPDANSGSKVAEEKFKDIVAAYQTLMKVLED